MKQSFNENDQLRSQIMSVPQDTHAVLFAVDYSGSTSMCAEYWDRVGELFDETLAQHPLDQITIVLWDHELKVVDEATLRETIEKRRGEGGTSPQVVAKYIVDHAFHNHLVLITDGEVYSIHDTEALLKDYPAFAQVDCHIINSGSHNLSVSCPFTRHLNSFVYTHTKEERKLVISVTQATQELVGRLATMSVDEFLTNYDTIEGYVVSQNMGRSGNDALRDLILKQKPRLMFEMMKKDQASRELEAVIRGGDLAQQTAFLRTFVDRYYAQMNEASFEQKIDHLVELCGDCTRVFDLSEIRSNRAKRAKKVEKNDVADVPEEKVAEVQSECMKMLVECPLSGEQDVPVLLFTATHILDGIPSNVANDIINMPLRLLNYPALVGRVRAALGGFVGLRSLKENALTESPLTGAPLAGGIVLALTDTTRPVIDFAVAKLFTREKLLGNPLYYLIALYEIVKDDETYAAALPAFQQLVIQRMQTTQTFASFSGAPQYVSSLLRVDLAMWFVLHSCVLNLPPPNNPLLLHTATIPVFLDMLALADLPVNPAVAQYLDRLVAMTVLRQMSFINADVFANLIAALYQNVVEINRANIRPAVLSAEHFVPFVLLDGPADEAQVARVLAACNPALRKCPVADLLLLAARVDQHIGAKSLVLPFELTGEPPRPATNWDGATAGGFVLRLDAMKRKFVKKYGFEPSRDEFLLFLARRVPVPTLPPLVLESN